VSPCLSARELEKMFSLFHFFFSLTFIFIRHAYAQTNVQYLDYTQRYSIVHGHANYADPKGSICQIPNLASGDIYQFFDSIQEVTWLRCNYVCRLVWVHNQQWSLDRKGVDWMGTWYNEIFLWVRFKIQCNSDGIGWKNCNIKCISLK